jgi:outer membrane protein assembly factor BamB
MLVVTGYLANDDGSRESAATVAFDATTGQQLWAAVFPSFTSADVTISRDGREVYAVGLLS